MISSTQPQLFNIALNPRDVVYTPDDVARDIVAYFKPTGRILEPCAGDGAFLKYLPPDAEWCEIEKGRDFFAEYRHFDWIIGNPPYSDWWKWIVHSFEISKNIVFLFPINKLFIAYYKMKYIYDWGGIRTLYITGKGTDVGFELGFATAAIHFQRNYHGGMFTVFRTEAA